MSIRTERAAAAATLVLAATSWFVTVQQMQGMDMGASTELGSLAFFVGVWVPMMTAMMLPAAVPALARRVRAASDVRAVVRFAGSYLAVWALVGLAVYVSYRPHGAAAAGAATVVAGLYELTPLKRRCRERCRGNVPSGLRFALYCVGSSIGLMVMLVALGVMSIAWMVAVAVLVMAQKFVPPRLSIDVPVGARDRRLRNRDDNDVRSGR